VSVPAIQASRAAPRRRIFAGFATPCRPKLRFIPDSNRPIVCSVTTATWRSSAKERNRYRSRHEFCSAQKIDVCRACIHAEGSSRLTRDVLLDGVTDAGCGRFSPRIRRRKNQGPSSDLRLPHLWRPSAHALTGKRVRQLARVKGLLGVHAGHCGKNRTWKGNLVVSLQPIHLVEGGRG
jgi:hypothetical protein